MKKLILALVLGCTLVTNALAAGGGIAWDKFPQEKMTDIAALQHGAKLFTNYCLNCHNAAFMRYNRMRDIGLTEEQIKQNLLFATDKVGETMKTSLDPKNAKDWFGGVPPDLTLIARSRSAFGQGSGADYVYTLLRTFYRDDTKPTGWNNLALPNIGMPHVLWELQGGRELTIVETRPVKSPEGKTTGWEEVRTVHAADGAATVARKPLAEYHGHGSFAYEFTAKDPAQAARFESDTADLVAFLHWMGEPAQGQRVRIGVWVLLFLGVFTVFAWFLNAAYWKEVK
jgi:ubiquinol-cytochrome c reductase cytochrome c1 subunit